MKNYKHLSCHNPPEKTLRQQPALFASLASQSVAWHQIESQK